MLDVEDEGFWNGVPPLELGPLPRLQDSVAVVGYPVGGDTISVTAGVVSRIEVTDYSHGSSDLLAIQIDAAINGGNSGGPVFNRSGQCVGIAFQVSIKRTFCTPPALRVFSHDPVLLIFLCFFTFFLSLMASLTVFSLRL